MVIPKMGRPAPRPARFAAAPPAVVEPPTKPTPPIVDAPKVAQQFELGLPTLGGISEAPPDRYSPLMKAAMVAVPALVIAAFVYFLTNGRPQAPEAAETFEAGPSLPVGMGGWISDYAPLSGLPFPRMVTILRASQNLTDFRMEFPGQIDSKALGWVFRAKDPKNFYVMKLEIVKPLPAAEGVVTHFAVINGQETPRVHVPLSTPLRPNTVYTVRTEALGSTFTTWLQDQKIDQWSDPQISAGAVGTYSEQGERGVLKGNMAVFTLVAKSQARR
jgi:hypothetical protein